MTGPDVLSLTGADSHRLVPTPGVGRPAIGPVRPGRPRPDLVVFPALAAARSVDVSVGPMWQPFDCASLLEFPELRRLALHGRLANLPALAGLRHLTGLQLRFSPDLAELPALATWPRLEHVIAWNVDAVAGRRLRGQLRPEFRDSSVSRLRTAQWFATEYGLPFAGWPSRPASTPRRPRSGSIPNGTSEPGGHAIGGPGARAGPAGSRSTRCVPGTGPTSGRRPVRPRPCRRPCAADRSDPRR
ncbi:hypothetical protein Aau02nite_79970 [Amorphoplanes auranticolor]|uniref:Uncharacterized protein n=1 Tax=Actinoplanes auranticolor TaxID=47988 RepID=A0A919W3C5_9ACTN|nr:hypothetical protein Aau02nite_79970 [Actinoplanes auranticolor]